MKDINLYIIEKLHIDKDTNVDTPLLENMIEVLKCFNYNDKKDNSNEVIDVLSNWLGTYNKHLSFYCPEAFYKFCGDLEYKNLSLYSVKDTLLEKVKDDNKPKEVYSKGSTKYFISRITQTEYDLIIYHNNLYTPIIFEKTKVWEPMKPYIIEKLHLDKDFKIDMNKYYDKLAFPIMSEYIFNLPKFKLENNGYSITNANDKVFITIDFTSNFENSKEIETFKEKLIDHFKKEDKAVKIDFSWDVNHNLKISFEN